MAEKVFPKGVMAFPKHERAPEWVVGSLVITPNDLFAWLKNEGAQYLTEYKGNKQIRLQITHGKEGKLTVAVDTFVPTKQSAPANTPVKPTTERNGVVTDNLDLPFILFVV